MREQAIYGTQSMDSFLDELRKKHSQIEIDYFQSNIEGELIDKLQSIKKNYTGVIINAGGYTHTSIAIADALASMEVPVVEVHISNLYKRETERQVSLTAKHCQGIISGFGLDSYRLAINYFLRQ